MLLFSWLTFDNFVLPELFLYGSMSPNDDKTSSLVPVSHEMVFYLKIHHTKSILFINGYSYSKCEFYRDIRRWRLSTTYLTTHVWKLMYESWYSQRVHPTVNEVQLSFWLLLKIMYLLLLLWQVFHLNYPG